MLRGKFIAENTHYKKKRRSQINNLTSHPKTLENKELTKQKADEGYNKYWSGSK